MEYAKILQQSAGKSDYRESPLKTVMKVNELKKTINKDGRANIIKQEPYANKIATYLSKEELKRKMNIGAMNYKAAVQDEYNNLTLNEYKNNGKDEEFMKKAREQQEFMKLLNDPSKIEYLNKVDPFSLFTLRKANEKSKQDFLQEKQELEEYKKARLEGNDDKMNAINPENPLIKVFASHPDDAFLKQLLVEDAKRYGLSQTMAELMAENGIGRANLEEFIRDKRKKGIKVQRGKLIKIGKKKKKGIRVTKGKVIPEEEGELPEEEGEFPKEEGELPEGIKVRTTKLIKIGKKKVIPKKEGELPEEEGEISINADIDAAIDKILAGQPIGDTLSKEEIEVLEDELDIILREEQEAREFEKAKVKARTIGIAQAMDDAPIAQKATKKSGKGFKPLSSRHPNRISHLINKHTKKIPIQNEYNREQAYHLTQKAIHGEGFFGDLKDKLGMLLFKNVHPMG